MTPAAYRDQISPGPVPGAQASGWIGFDLDGTLARYDGWRGDADIGRPIPAACLLAKQLIAAGARLRIMTARVSRAHHTAEEILANTVFIQDWTEVFLGVRLPVTAEKDMLMQALYDDRAIPLEFNTGRLGVIEYVEIGVEVLSGGASHR